jgi:hypothetical protein
VYDGADKKKFSLLIYFCGDEVLGVLVPFQREQRLE